MNMKHETSVECHTWMSRKAFLGRPSMSTKVHKCLRMSCLSMHETPPLVTPEVKSLVQRLTAAETILVARLVYKSCTPLELGKDKPMAGRKPAAVDGRAMVHHNTRDLCGARCAPYVVRLLQAISLELLADRARLRRSKLARPK